MLGLAPSTFYYHRNKPIAADAYIKVRPVLCEIFDRAYRSYGYRRVRFVLASKHNMHLSGKTVLKLMHQENRICQVRRRKYRSYQGQVGLAAPNLLDRDFFASTPNSKWVTDVTEFVVLGQKHYLSPVIDLFNGEVITYQLGSAPALGLVTTMLDKALATIDKQTKPMIHSDQGWHYRHIAYRNALQSRGLAQSMSRKGNCLDNAVAENFFGHFKEEFLRQATFASLGQFKNELETYIHWFNNDRIRLKLKGLSPVDYRIQSLDNISPTLK
jgi:putative transposase